MKTMKCDLCDYEVTAGNFEDWMNTLKPHYAEIHKDFMQEQMQKTPEEQMVEMKKWMEVNRRRFKSIE